MASIVCRKCTQIIEIQGFLNETRLCRLISRFHIEESFSFEKFFIFDWSILELLFACFCLNFLIGPKANLKTEQVKALVSDKDDWFSFVTDDYEKMIRDVAPVFPPIGCTGMICTIIFCYFSPPHGFSRLNIELDIERP